LLQRVVSDAAGKDCWGTTPRFYFLRPGKSASLLKSVKAKSFPPPCECTCGRGHKFGTNRGKLPVCIPGKRPQPRTIVNLGCPLSLSSELLFFVEIIK